MSRPRIARESVLVVCCTRWEAHVSISEQARVKQTRQMMRNVCLQSDLQWGTKGGCLKAGGVYRKTAAAATKERARALSSRPPA